MNDDPTGDRPPAVRPLAERPPAAITHLARERAQARAARDFATADALKAQIEEAGWRVVDHRGGSTVELAAPPDRLATGGIVVHGASRSVPSVLAEPPSCPVSVVVPCADPERAARVAQLLARSAARPQIILVVAEAADGTGPTDAATGAVALARSSEDGMAASTEQVVMAAGLTPAALLNAGIRRARGEVVVLGDPDRIPDGDLISPFLAVFRDPRVSCAGPDGLGSTDLRRFEPSGGPTVAALTGGWLAFRRSDYATLGPLDERFHGTAHLVTWWSLVLRDGAPAASHEETRAAELRTAIRVAPPLARPTGTAPAADADRDRAERRDRYRVIDAFGGRLDLAVAPTPLEPR